MSMEFVIINVVIPFILGITTATVLSKIVKFFK